MGSPAKLISKQPIDPLEELYFMDPVFIGFGVAIIAVVLTILFFWFLTRKKTSRQCVLLIGLSEAGKTLLFSRLVAKKVVSSFTSMKENVAPLLLERNKSVRLIDIPGNDRLRLKFLEEYKNLARAIVFVVDSLNFPREIRDVAELLFTILGDKSILGSSVPFLIACNKQDEAMSKSSKVIQSQLEKEINMLRVTQSSGLDSISEGGSTASFLGRRGKDFTFSDLKPLNVDFLECCAKDEGDEGLAGLHTWLNRIS